MFSFSAECCCTLLSFSGGKPSWACPLRVSCNVSRPDRVLTAPGCSQVFTVGQDGRDWSRAVDCWSVVSVSGVIRQGQGQGNTIQLHHFNTLTIKVSVNSPLPARYHFLFGFCSQRREERGERRERGVTTELTTDCYQHSPGSPSPWTGSDTRREYRAATV